jgi:hypothetical protein
MPVLKSHYEELLATYSQSVAVIDLFKGYRSYLEMIPSMRRAQESVITVPLPIVRLRHTAPSPHGHGIVRTTEPVMLAADVGVILCDPEWQIKTGREIFIFIHRPDEDFSELLGRWRQTQVLLGKDYEWLLPSRYQHFLSDGAEKIHPLFVLFESTPDRVLKGLQGAGLPYIISAVNLPAIETGESTSESTLADPVADHLTLGALLAQETEPTGEEELRD